MVNVAYRVLGVSVAVDDIESNESFDSNSKEVIEDASELTKASKSLNETSIIKIRDASIQLQVHLPTCSIHCSILHETSLI